MKYQYRIYRCRSCKEIWQTDWFRPESNRDELTLVIWDKKKLADITSHSNSNFNPYIPYMIDLGNLFAWHEHTNDLGLSDLIGISKPFEGSKNKAKKPAGKKPSSELHLDTLK